MLPQMIGIRLQGIICPNSSTVISDEPALQEYILAFGLLINCKALFVLISVCERNDLCIGLDESFFNTLMYCGNSSFVIVKLSISLPFPIGTSLSDHNLVIWHL